MPADLNNYVENPWLIILEDLFNDDYLKDVCNLFTKGNHHRKISVILITQNLFHQGKYSRDISLNAKYNVVLNNVRDRDQFSHLARQVLPHDIKGLLQAYLHATEASHGYLLLDLSQDTDDSLRFRTSIFQTKHPLDIYIDICNETHKGKLPHPSPIKKLGQNYIKPSYRTVTGMSWIVLASVSWTSYHATLHWRAVKSANLANTILLIDK